MLAIKLLVPRPPHHFVPRPHLFELIDDGLEGPVTLIAAQPGAGKTALLSSWVEVTEYRESVVWVTLDGDDDDPDRFWHLLLTAVRRAGLTSRDSEPTDMDEPPAIAGAADMSVLMAVLITLPDPIVLVLDDLHTITAPAVLDELESLLRYAPSKLKLIISTRADPAISVLPRLRVDGQLTEVRASDLAFSLEEADALLKSYNVALANDALAVLHSRTEGWAAGLRLAAMSLHNHHDPSQVVADFAGTDRAISDYLVAEVLDRQPARIRQFLLQTSLTARITADLANALTGRNDGEQTLAQLERDNAFVVPLGTDRVWYRYQHLFAEVLQYELRRQAPAELESLHRRAAAWYGAHDFPVEAAQHALAARDWTESTGLIVNHGLDLALSGKTAIIRKLVEELPESLVRRSPELGALLAFDSLELLDFGQAGAFLNLIRDRRSLVPDDRREEFGLLLSYLRLMIGERWGKFDEMLIAGREIVELQASRGMQVVGRIHDQEIRAVALADLGVAELWTGRLDTAEPRLREAQLRAIQTRMHRVRLRSMSHLSLLHAAHGHLLGAAETAEAALELANEHDLSGHETAGARLALAHVNLEWNDFALARHHLHQALSASDGSPWRPLEISAALVHGWLCMVEGNPQEGLAVLRAARPLLGDRTTPPWFERWFDVTDANLRFASGDLPAVRSVLHELREDNVGGAPWSAPVAVTLANVHLADGKPAAALETLAPYVDGSKPLLPGPLISASILAACAARTVGDEKTEARAIEHALAIAEQHGYRERLTAPAVRALLTSHLARVTAHRLFIARLLDTPRARPTPRKPTFGTLVEPLSEREREVLRYLPSWMSAAEIALDLYVSVHTVKTHMRHIYRKLQATSRREAVDRAHDLGLL